MAVAAEIRITSPEIFQEAKKDEECCVACRARAMKFKRNIDAMVETIVDDDEETMPSIGRLLSSDDEASEAEVYEDEGLSEEEIEDNRDIEERRSTTEEKESIASALKDLLRIPQSSQDPLRTEEFLGSFRARRSPQSSGRTSPASDSGINESSVESTPEKPSPPQEDPVLKELQEYFTVKCEPRRTTPPAPVVEKPKPKISLGPVNLVFTNGQDFFFNDKARNVPSHLGSPRPDDYVAPFYPESPRNIPQRTSRRHK